MLGILPWLLLLAAFVLCKENRRWPALWILLPVVIFRLLWAGFTALSKIPSDTSALFVAIINCILTGFVLNWLLAERIGNRNRFVTWLLAWLVFILALAMTLFTLGIRMEAFQVSVTTVLTVGILLLSFALAGFMCRKKFRPVRFSLWMALWVLLTTSAFFIGVAAIQAMMIDYSFMRLLLQVLMVSLVYALLLIAAMLPFEIVLFVNHFWRKRFDSVFRLKTPPVVMKSVWAVDDPSEPQRPAAQ
jgi:hypothetical protein